MPPAAHPERGWARGMTIDQWLRRLTNDYLRDLVADLRCARRDCAQEYAQDCMRTFRRLWPRRHTVGSLTRFGIPIPSRPIRERVILREAVDLEAIP